MREKVLAKFNGKCAYCGCSLGLKEMQIDHIIPKKKGGKNDLSNYNPSCRQCNFYKGTFSIEEFRENLESLHERLTKIFIVRLARKHGILSFDKTKIEFYYENPEMLESK